MQNFNIDNINWAATGVIVTVVIAIISGIIFMVKKSISLGKILARLDNVEKTIEELKTETSSNYKELNKGISSILKMIAEKGLAKSSSPRVLTDEGIKVLENSGIKEIVNDMYDSILNEVKKSKPKNPYQAEQAVLDVVSNLKNDPSIKDKIEKGAFESGYFVDSVLFAGGLFIRDRILEDIGFKTSEIDKHVPKKKK